MGPTNVQRTMLLLGALLMALGIAGYSLRRAKAAAGNLAAAKAAAQDSAGPTDAAKVIRFVKDPEPEPVTQARDLDGNAISLDAWKGKVVIVNFWATWCPPCREEIPEMIALQTKYKDKLQILGVSEDDDPPAKVQKFAQQHGMNYPIVMYTDQIVGAWGGVPALPTSFVVDTQGRVVTKHMGLKDEATYDREIRALLGMPVDEKVERVADIGQVFMKNAANATDLPDVDFTGLSAAQKKVALHQLNSEACTCGCKMTLSQCRINDETCPISKQRAAEVVAQVHDGSATKPGGSKAAPPASDAAKPL
jgi:thiol-disulfide isomerase/thioredoxin